MLPRTSHTSNSSNVQSAGTISPLQEYGYSNVPSSMFVLPTDKDQEENNSHASQDREKRVSSDEHQEMTTFIPANSFQEIVSSFFVAGHKRLLMIQSKLNQERDSDHHSLLSIRGANAQKIMELRKHYYEVQMILYKMPKGRQHDSAL